MIAGCPYITLMTETAPQRDYPMRELLNALRYLVRYGSAWRAMPNDLPPCRRSTSRPSAGSRPDVSRPWLRTCAPSAPRCRPEKGPTAAVIDSRTLRSTPESGPRAGYDGAKRKRGSKVHLAVDTLGHLLALHVTPADVGDRQAVARLAADIQEATGDTVKLASVDQGYTGKKAAEAAAAEGITLEVVELPEAKRGFVLLPRRWVVERSFAWATHCPRLVKDYERYAEHCGFHVVAFVGYMLKHAAALVQGA